jgi:hypothetical protein
MNYRLEHLDDPVPLLLLLDPYYHVSPGYNILAGNNVTVTPAEINIDPGIDASIGTLNLTLDLSFYVDAHLWYFQDISQCHTPDAPIMSLPFS